MSEADELLVSGRAEEAVRAYRAAIAESAEPRPDAWVGLALAVHRLETSPLRVPLAERLPLIFDVHARLDGAADPLDLAGWFR